MIEFSTGAELIVEKPVENSIFKNRLKNIGSVMYCTLLLVNVRRSRWLSTQPTECQEVL